MFIVTNEYKNLTCFQTFSKESKTLTLAPLFMKYRNNNLDREADTSAHKIFTQQLILKGSNTCLSKGLVNQEATVI